MTRPRKRPTLSVPLGREGRKKLAEHVRTVNEAGDAARKKLAKSTGRKPGKAPAAKGARSVARGAKGVERELQQAVRRRAKLYASGAYTEADRVEETIAGLERRLRRARKADLRAAGRRARLDRFALMVKRSATLSDWHWVVADRWLAAVDAAADGLMQRAAEPEAATEALEPGARDPATGLRYKPDLDGPAIFLRGRSVLDRWTTGVPVWQVERGRRTKPQTFDPKPVKRMRGQGASSASVQEAAFHRQTRAEQLEQAFRVGVRRGGFPDWTVAVAIRVIRGNERMTDAMNALGVGVRSATCNQLHCAVAAGLSGVARALGMAVEE